MRVHLEALQALVILAKHEGLQLIHLKDAKTALRHVAIVERPNAMVGQVRHESLKILWSHIHIARQMYGIISKGDRYIASADHVSQNSRSFHLSESILELS